MSSVNNSECEVKQARNSSTPDGGKVTGGSSESCDEGSSASGNFVSSRPKNSTANQNFSSSKKDANDWKKNVNEDFLRSEENKDQENRVVSELSIREFAKYAGKIAKKISFKNGTSGIFVDGLEDCAKELVQETRIKEKNAFSSRSNEQNNGRGSNRRAEANKGTGPRTGKGKGKGSGGGWGKGSGQSDNTSSMRSDEKLSTYGLDSENFNGILSKTASLMKSKEFLEQNRDEVVEPNKRRLFAIAFESVTGRAQNHLCESSWKVP